MPPPPQPAPAPLRCVVVEDEASILKLLLRLLAQLEGVAVVGTWLWLRPEPPAN